MALEQDPQESDLVFVVPADSEPLVGRGDVRVSPETSGERPLVLRLALGCWLRTRDLVSLDGGGQLSAIDLARSLERLRGLEDEPVEMAQRAEEELTTAYREWLGEVVAPARHALERWALRAQREATELGTGSADSEPEVQRPRAMPRWQPPLAASSPNLIRDVHSSLRQPEREFRLAGGAGEAELRLSTSPAGLLPWIRRPQGCESSTRAWSRLFAYYADGTRVFARWTPDEGQEVLASRSVLPWGDGGTHLVLDGEVVGEYWIEAQDFS